MSCCGNKRMALHEHSFNHIPSDESFVSEKTAEDVYFEYTGTSALTVTGSITGKKYRFPNPGDQQPVDYRDAGAMMAVPMLRTSRGSSAGRRGDA